MKKENWRFWILFLVITFTIFLTFNRFFSQSLLDFPFRNYLEHIIWGFTLPILTTIFVFGFQVLSKIKLSWKMGYFLGLFIFLVVGLWYYIERGTNLGLSYLDYFKIILDIIGFSFSSWFILSGRSKD